MTGLILPTSPNKIRVDAYLASNGVSIMNAATMWYGGAKSGKTRLIISAFGGSDYVFLDFDRNYKSTIDDITKSGASYFNGSNAYAVLDQVMDGKVSDGIFVIDALGSVITYLATRWNHLNSKLTQIDLFNIGKTHEATVYFFNMVIEPMTSNGNSVNFIHHTTQNSSGEKMEGNQGAWLSVFDFTYEMDRETKTFQLKAGRLPVAPNTVGSDNIYDRINKTISAESEVVDMGGGKNKLLISMRQLMSMKSYRPILNPMIVDGSIAKIKVGRKEYIDATLMITSSGQAVPDSDGNPTSLAIPSLEPIAEEYDAALAEMEAL